MMRADCIAAVQRAAAAAGRSITQAELQGIEQRFRETLRRMARNDRQKVAGMSPAERMKEAARLIAADLAAEKTRKAVNTARQIIATDRNVRYIEDAAARGVSRFESLQRLIVNFADAASGARSLEQVADGVRQYYMRELTPVIRATQRFLGFWTNRAMVRDLVRELYGQNTGNAGAREAARAWSDFVAEPMRRQANELGQNIRKLADWAVPQHHSQEKVARAGAFAWVDFIIGRLDRDAYVNPDGTLMDDSALRTMLGSVWQRIATDGASDIQAGKITGRGDVANRGQEARALHFKSADDYLNYQAKFGDQSILEAMIGHVNRHARDIATMQVFGPNAESAFRFLLDGAMQKEATATPGKTGAFERAQAKTQKYFDAASGRAGAIANPVIANIFNGWRSIQAAAMLGMSPISAITDTATLHMVSLANGLPQWNAFYRELRAYLPFDPEKGFIERQGFGIETLAHDVSRFGEEVIGHGIPSILANTLFKVSGMNRLDAARRRAGAAVMMDGIGQLTRKHATLAAIDPNDHALLLAKGISEKTWEIWRAAELDGRLLTPDGIARIPDAKLAHLGDPAKLRRDAMQELIGVVQSEVHTIVPLATAKTQADMQHFLGNPQRGTLGGELIRSVLQFKSFPVSIIATQWARAMSRPSAAGKALYGASFVAASTILGAMVVQLKAMIGRTQNPQDMTDAKFWGRAVVQGGAFGLYGDLAISGWSTDVRQSLAELFGGPTLSNAQRAYDLAETAIHSVDSEKKVDVAGKAVGLAKANLPFGNLWYAKAALDHLIFQELQDYFSPGYARRMEQRARREYGTGYFWPPATGVDRIEPVDFANATGQ